jgi:hypothetical protein
MAGRLSESAGWVRPLALAPDGRRLATAGLEGRILVIDPRARERLATVTTNGIPIWGLAWDPPGAALWAACDDGVLRQYALGA